MRSVLERLLGMCLLCEYTEQICIRLINLVNGFSQDWSINIFLFLLDDGLSASSCEYERERSKLKEGLQIMKKHNVSVRDYISQTLDCIR